MKKKISLVICIALMGSILLSGCSSKKDDVVKEEKKNTYQGNIEAVEVDINTKIPGKVGNINFEEGAKVKEGDVIANIDSKELTAKREQTQALSDAAKAQYDASLDQVNAAKSQLDKAQNGARDQEIAQAQAMYDLASKTYARVDALYQKGAVSAQKRDEAQAQLDMATQQLSMAQQGARTEDISGAQSMVAAAMNMSNAAKAKYEQAQAGLDEVNAYIADTIIKSPINGVITSLNVDSGELVSTGMPLATVSDLNNMWIQVNMDETEISKVKIGQTVKVTIPAYKDKVFEGQVTKINKNPDFAVKKATNENGDFDIISYGVKIKINNQEDILRPGMTAFVDFE